VRRGKKKRKKKKKIIKWWDPLFGGGTRGTLEMEAWKGNLEDSRNGGLEGEFRGLCKMEGHLEVLLELSFYSKPPKFGVEDHIEAPARVALNVNKTAKNRNDTIEPPAGRLESCAFSSLPPFR
jgi:hypothetical protein